MRKVITGVGVAAAYLMLAVATYFVTSSVISSKRAEAAPAAGMASDCAPDWIGPQAGFGSGFHTGQVYASENPSLFTYKVYGGWNFTCPPPGAWYASSCSPCYKLRLYRNTGYPNNPPAWVDQQRAESDFYFTGSMSGQCGTGGTAGGSFTLPRLTSGQYEIQIEFGAGDDRRCYVLATFAHTFIIP
jgi:hypothetical protein